MNAFSLDGDWSLYYLEDGPGIETPEHPGAVFVPAQAPGNVELDLQRAGLLPEPFYATNTRLLRPLERYEWWYEREFKLPADWSGEHLDLVFEGLDLLAAVWLNGELVGRADNALIPWRFDASRAARPGETNRLVVRLAPVMQAAQEMVFEPGMLSWEHRFEGLRLRKAPHVWGWDILPRAVSAGIWRSVRLEVVPENRIDWIYYWTIAIGEEELDPSLSSGQALGVRFQVQVAREIRPGIDRLEMRFDGECGDSRFSYTWPLEFTSDGCTIPVPGAKLWWPAGYGESDLYTVTASLYQGERLLAQRTDRVGIRKLVVSRSEVAGNAWTPQPAAAERARLDTEPDPGSQFVIYVNDTPIMVKGTNWVPLDAFHSRDAGRLERALALVEDLGCNMLRCWGGNVYESEAFFDWCDAHGVMVWQDFAFACCLYPQTDDFLSKVQQEAEAVVKRLRNHACLALWCGDNEIDMAYLSEGRDPGRNRLTREVLPQVIERLDPQRHFVPSSPYVPPVLVGRKDAWQQTPEQHLWGPRGYFKGPFYTRHSAHFIGEIGYHGCPGVSSLSKFLSPVALPPEAAQPWSSPQAADEWQVHAVYHWQHGAIDRDRIRLMVNQVREFFGVVPDDLETFVLASQIVQAEAKKFFIESTRLRKWQTSGILWWNLVDGWPQFSDAVVDYYFEKKLAYEFIRRCQRPVCLVVGEVGTGKYLPLVASNDTRREAHLKFRAWDADTDEQVVAGECSVPANQNWQVGRLRTFASDQRMILVEWEYDGVIYRNHYLAASPPVSLERYKNWLGKII
jgi:beta-mannosidase